ncbi:MAG: hypothetical protein ACRC5T_03640 [Cetobacterium sp.]
MKSDFVKVFAIDPGKATGLSLFEWDMAAGDHPALLWSSEVQFEEYIKVVRDTLTEYPDVIVICEKFTITVETAKKSQAPFSLECIGALKLIMLETGRSLDDLHLQLPADAMRMFDNPKLKKMKYWHRGGEGHALDSIRHGLLAMVRLGWNFLPLMRD